MAIRIEILAVCALVLVFASCSSQSVVPKRIGAPDVVVDISAVRIAHGGELTALTLTQPNVKRNQPFVVRVVIADGESVPNEGWLRIAIYSENDTGHKRSSGSVLVTLSGRQKEFQTRFAVGIAQPGEYRLCLDVVGTNGDSRALGFSRLVIGSD